MVLPRLVQSHGGQVRHLADIPLWCDDVTDSADPARYARRAVLKAAVLGRREEPGHQHAPAAPDAPDAAAGTLRYAVSGTILDISPHILVLWTRDGEQRFPLAPDGKAWRGTAVSPAALRRGGDAPLPRQP